MNFGIQMNIISYRPIIIYHLSKWYLGNCIVICSSLWFWIRRFFNCQINNKGWFMITFHLDIHVFERRRYENKIWGTLYCPFNILHYVFSILIISLFFICIRRTFRKLHGIYIKVMDAATRKIFWKTAFKQARLVPLHFDKSRKRTLCKIGNHLFHIIKGKKRFQKY